jgi:hypothetical protein
MSSAAVASYDIGQGRVREGEDAYYRGIVKVRVLTVYSDGDVDIAFLDGTPSTVKWRAVAGRADETVEKLFEFLTQKYAQRADARQKAMGNQYTEAETHDLAYELSAWFGRYVAGDVGS